MKNIYHLFAALVLTASISSAATTFTGASLVNTPGLTNGQIGVYLLSLDGTTFAPANLSIAAGADITLSATYGSSFRVLDTGTVFTFGNTQLSETFAVTYGSGVDQNDAFAILVFNSNNPSGGSGFNIFTDGSWILPADAGSTFTFGTGIAQQGSGATPAAGSVIPEPSAVLLGGLGALLLLRRRRNHH